MPNIDEYICQFAYDVGTPPLGDNLFYASSPKDAAEKFASFSHYRGNMLDHAENYWEGDYAIWVKHVHTGKVSWFNMLREAVPQFTAEKTYRS